MGHIRSVFCALCILITVSACQFAEEQQNSTPTRPPGLINWDRDPSAIVFRADVVGGSQNTSRLSETPLCTIYGDNRVVWVNELDAFNVEILYDQLEDVVIGDFVTYLTVNERIYTYEALASEHDTGSTSPVVETVTLNVNGDTHTADGFSGWDSDWFARVLRACQRISQSPILFAPSGAWLTVESAAYNIESPTTTWNPQETELSLNEVANDGQPRWIEGGNLQTLWNYTITLPSTLLLSEDGNYYRIALQVPGITRTSPPPP
jgi:hypothetical protein